jgi:transcriptional regulator with XRE-family HTH domain
MKKVIYSSDHKLLIARLKKARLDAGLDQLSAARGLGKSQSYISKIESGQRRVDIVQLKQFAKLYKKDLEFFLKWAVY